MAATPETVVVKIDAAIAEAEQVPDASQVEAKWQVARQEAQELSTGTGGTGLTVSQSKAIAGATVAVSWVGLSGHTRYAWVALMRKGPAPYASMYVYADAVNANTPTFFYWLDGSVDTVFEQSATPPLNPGPAAGTVHYKLPDLMPSGEYFFRLWRAILYKGGVVDWCPGGTYIDSPSITVANKAPTLTLDNTVAPISKTSGQTVTVAWSGVSTPHVNDYFILLPLNRPFMAHEQGGIADTAPGPSAQYGGNRWHWRYADGTEKDNLTTAPRGQASGSFKTFPIPADLIAGDYIIYMVRNRLSTAGYTKRTICAHSAPITVGGVDYPADYPLVGGGTFAPPDLMAIECTSDSVWNGNGLFVQYRPQPWFRGHHEYGNDGVCDFVRVSSSNHHNFFEMTWKYTGPEVYEIFSRYWVYLEDSFMDCIRPDGGGTKFPGGIAFGDGAEMWSAGDITEISGTTTAGMLRQPGFANQTIRITDYLQWTGQDDVGYGHINYPGAPGSVNNKGYLAAHVAGLQRRRWYRIEQRLKRNTVTAGVGDANAETDQWINGTWTGSGRNFVLTNKAWNQFAIPFRLPVKVYHGGQKHIAVPQGYVRLAKMAWSTRRIGPN